MCRGVGDVDPFGGLCRVRDIERLSDNDFAEPPRVIELWQCQPFFSNALFKKVPHVKMCTQCEGIQSLPSPFLCGSSVTIADLWALPQFRYYVRGIADHVPADCLNPYTSVQAWMQRMYSIPAIKDWYKM